MNLAHPKPSGTVSVIHRFDASPEQVFDAWLDPASACLWLFATENGRMERVEINAETGGQFSIIEHRDGQDVEHVGTYEQMDRPYRLIFTFSVPIYSKQETRVAVAIVPRDNGSELTLTHEGVGANYIERTHAGWTMILENLDKVLKKSD